MIEKKRSGRRTVDSIVIRPKPVKKTTQLIEYDAKTKGVHEEIISELRELWTKNSAFKSFCEKTASDLAQKLLVFKNPPKQTRLDYLSSFALFAFDVKLTPDNKPFFTEVNGFSSGMNGFKEAGVPECSIPHGQNDPGDTLWAIKKFGDFVDWWTGIKTNPCEFRVKSHIEGFGKSQVEYISLVLFDSDMGNWRLKGHDSDVLLRMVCGNSKNWFEKFAHKGWEEYRPIGDRLVSIEDILESKLATDYLFENLRYVKPETLPFTEVNFAKTCRSAEEFVVVKPDEGMQGQNIIILKNDPAEIKKLNCAYDNPFDFRGFVCEPFIPSKPIYCKKTRKYHDGCVRYVVLVEHDKSGKVNLFHYSGYWRLCPEPVSSDNVLASKRANLSAGAIPQSIGRNDLRIVQDCMNQVVPIFYTNLIKEVDEQLEGRI